MFVDIVRSTQLLQQVGTHEAPAVMDAALQRFADIVQQQGGRVLQFTGDGLKAAFGTQGVHEDEAEHAVRAGLAILQAAADHSQRIEASHGITHFAVRAGIHTGPVMLGGGVEADRTAIGESVHLAARMEQSAPEGRLRISQDTYAQVRGLFEMAPQPPLQVKGVEQPLQTWLVLREIPSLERAAQRGIDGLQTPLVGRAAELERLLQVHSHCVGNRRLQLACVTADAGLGKTRLRLELLQRLLLHTEGQGLLQARAHPDTHLQAYGLLRQLLARWLRISDDLDGASARQRLVQGLTPWLSGRADLRAQWVGQLLGMDFQGIPAVRALGPRELRSQAFDALREALRALAATSPLLLVLDDLHWADAASLDFVEHLAQPCDVPLMLLLLTRPTLRERRELKIALPEAHQCHLELQPLDARQGPSLAAALLAPMPDAPAELHRLLVDRAGGNPFYMEELLRMLIDDGIVDAQQQPWQLRRHWQQALRVPSTLVGVLQARLDALPADELATLQQASIVGPVFWDQALEAIDPAATGRLPALHGRRLVQPRSGSAFAQSHELAFQHQLLHEVTYDTVLAPARRAGHARVARWLAERVADRAGEFLGITAEHFERAGDSENALEYYDRARADAELRFAREALLGFVDRCLRQPALASPRWRYRLLGVRQYTLEAQGRAAEAAAALDAMQAYAEQLDDDALRADALSARMLQADREGDAARAEALAHRVIELVSRAPEPGAAALAHGELAWLAVVRQDHETARQHLQEGLVWARRAAALRWRDGGYAGYELQLRTIGIESLLMQRRSFEAAAAIEEAIEAIPPQRLRDRVQLLQSLSRARINLGDLAGAEAAAHASRELAERIEVPALVMTGDVLFARLRGMQGRPGEQATLGAQVERTARDRQHASLLSDALIERASALMALGEVDTARGLWRECERIATELDNPGRRLEARLGLLRADALSGQPAAGVADGVARALSEPFTDGQAPLEGPDRWDIAADAVLQEAWSLLQAAAHPLASAVRAELQRRLQSLLSQAPDEATRERLTHVLPHWRAVAQA